MVDENYIKSAAELADGLDINVKAHLQYLKEPSQWALDALAAQLVRQVDAISSEETWWFTQQRAACYLYAGDHNTTAGKHDVFMAKGPDRTMNTIKAIVDSGVLENAE